MLHFRFFKLPLQAQAGVTKKTTNKQKSLKREERARKEAEKGRKDWMKTEPKEERQAGTENNNNLKVDNRNARKPEGEEL